MQRRPYFARVCCFAIWQKWFCPLSLFAPFLSWRTTSSHEPQIHKPWNLNTKNTKPHTLEHSDKFCFASAGTQHHACRCPCVLFARLRAFRGLHKPTSAAEGWGLPTLSPTYPSDAHLQHTATPGQWAPHRPKRGPPEPQRAPRSPGNMSTWATTQSPS